MNLYTLVSTGPIAFISILMQTKLCSVLLAWKDTQAARQGWRGKDYHRRSESLYKLSPVTSSKVCRMQGNVEYNLVVQFF